jgi:hypothetical protein
MNELDLIETKSFFKECNYLENLEKDTKSIKKSITLEQNFQGVYVWVVASHKNFDLNQKMEIKTDFGIPLTPEVHDKIRDVYYAEGTNIHFIGYIPVSYRLIIEDSNFELIIPLPLSIIKKYMTDCQKKNYKEWKNSLENINLEFRFFQILDTK